MSRMERSRGAEFFLQLWSQALVAVNSAEDEAQRMLNRVQGIVGWTQEESFRQAREFQERLIAQRREMEKRVDELVRASVTRVQVPRREELAQLSARLESLAKRVEALSK